MTEVIRLHDERDARYVYRAVYSAATNGDNWIAKVTLEEYDEKTGNKKVLISKGF